MTPAELRAQVSGSSFYAGMRVLPRREREAMYAVYGFCRIVDDIADDLSGNRAARMAELDGWRRDLDALYAGRDAGRAAFLAEAVRGFDLDRADFEAVIDGMATDVAADVRWPPAAELDRYCDRVASAVGRLSVRVFGMEREAGRQLAHHLGRALQLTNILRDIDEDAAIGRVYLPREALAAARVPMDTPAQVAADPRIDPVARALAGEAQAHFLAARGIMRRRPRGYLLAPRLMEAAYARLLTRMERNGWRAPRRRVRVSKPGLILTALRIGLTGR